MNHTTTVYSNYSVLDINQGLPKEIQTYTIFQYVTGLTLLILVMMYFPKEPELPPAPVNIPSKAPYLSALKKLSGSKGYHQISWCFALTQGPRLFWQSFLPTALSRQAIGSQDAELVFIMSLLIPALVAPCIVYLVDRHRIKKAIILLSMLTTLGLLSMTLMFWGVLPLTVPLLHVSAIGAASAGFSCMPLLFDMAMKKVKVSSEAITGTGLTFQACAISTILVMCFELESADTGVIWLTITSIQLVGIISTILL